MALDVGCGRGHVAKQMNSDILGTLYQCDMAENMVVSYVTVYLEFMYVCAVVRCTCNCIITYGQKF